MKSANQPLVIQKEDSIQESTILMKNDCFTCHQGDDKLTGLSLASISGRYLAIENNLNMLAHKIIEGGEGHWGKIPMTPHPALSQADANVPAKYILSLKR